MPFFPDIPVWANTTLNTQNFLGLNRGLSISDGEMADMLNMTGDYYPVLSTRSPRGTTVFDVEGGGKTSYEDGVSGMLSTDKLIVCSGEKVYMDGVEIPLKISAEETMQPKHMVSMGAYVCIWPDKVYFNRTDPSDCGPMGSKWTADQDAVITAMMCRKDGTDYDMESIIVGSTAPAEPEDQQFWLDTSGENDVLKQYSAIYAEWVQVATTYIKIQADGIGKGLKESDVVHLSGVKALAMESALADGTETLSFKAEDFSLYSSFSTARKSSSWVSTTPTIAERAIRIDVSGIPDGAAVKSAVVRFSAGSPMYGRKLLTMNGTSFDYGQDNELPVEVNGNGTVNLLFRFQSGNNTTSAGNHGGSVTISGLTLDVTYTSEAGGAGDSDANQLDALNTTNIIYGCGEDYIIVAGLLHESLTLANTLTCELKIPDLDYVCEANNRLWGCSYTTIDGKLTNEIRCCALGDFRNWYKFEGTSMDSYVASVGSDGKFTAAFSLQGVPLFWKEDCLHKITGTQPSNFTLNTLKCRGVQEGSWRSLAVVNEALYYKSRGDVMAYDGSMPVSVSEKLGTDRYYEAVAGAYRDKYYISMRDKKVVWHVYVFDATKGLWHKEDETSIRHMASYDGDLVFAIENDDSTVLRSVGNPTGEKELLDWQVTFGTFGYAYEQQKYLSRFNIRAMVPPDSTMTLEIMYDSDGEWVNMGTVRSRSLRTFMLPVIPRRCDHCQVRLSGKGSAKIYSVARIFENGGDG